MSEPTKLLNKNFFLLWQGQLVSRIGTSVFFIAMGIYIKHATESASLMGSVMMVAGLPAVLLAPFAGAFADRYSRRKIVIVSDFLNAIAVLAFGFYLYFAPDAKEVIMLLLFVIALIISSVSAFFLPAVAASIPDIVPKSKLTSANSLGQVSLQSSNLVGQAAGPILFGILGAPVLTLLNGLSYLYAGISKIFIKIPQVIPERKDSLKGQMADFKKDLKEGFFYVWHNTGLRILVFFSALLAFFSSMIYLLLLFFIEDFLHVDARWWGFLGVGMGVGSLLGYTFAGMVKFTPSQRGRIMIVFIFLNAVAYGALGFVNLPIVALIIMFVSGFLRGFVSVNISVTLQLTTPSEIRGRVFGLLSMISGSLAPIGMGLGGMIADLVNKDIPLIYKTCGAIMVCLTIAAASSKSFRDYLATDREIKISKKPEDDIVPDVVL